MTQQGNSCNLKVALALTRAKPDRRIILNQLLTALGRLSTTEPLGRGFSPYRLVHGQKREMSVSHESRSNT